MVKRTLAAVVLILVGLVSTGAKRRAVASAPCPLPTLAFTTRPPNVCGSDPFIIEWKASQPNAFVSIEGIGNQLPPTGAINVYDGRHTFTGTARNVCGTGPRADYVVRSTAAPAAQLSGLASIAQGTSTTFAVTVSNATKWTLASTLGNPLSQLSGTSSTSVEYTGTAAGDDTLVLTVSGGCSSDPLQRTAAITVTRPSTPPPPPPPPGGLRCCDGTLSKTCFNCASKQGCCSGHGGVCGCL